MNWLNMHSYVSIKLLGKACRYWHTTTVQQQQRLYPTPSLGQPTNAKHPSHAMSPSLLSPQTSSNPYGLFLISSVGTLPLSIMSLSKLAGPLKMSPKIKYIDIDARTVKATALIPSWTWTFIRFPRAHSNNTNII